MIYFFTKKVAGRSGNPAGRSGPQKRMILLKKEASSGTIIDNLSDYSEDMDNKERNRGDKRDANN